MINVSKQRSFIWNSVEKVFQLKLDFSEHLFFFWPKTSINKNKCCNVIIQMLHAAAKTSRIYVCQIFYSVLWRRKINICFILLQKIGYLKKFQLRREQLISRIRIVFYAWKFQLFQIIVPTKKVYYQWQIAKRSKLSHSKSSCKNFQAPEIRCMQII